MLSRQLPRLVTRRARFPQSSRQLRYQSTSTASGSSSNFATGVLGGVVGATLAYGVYSFTPAGRTASKLNKAAAEANKKYDAAAKSLQKNTPTADQAVDSIKQFAYSYAAWIPGGRGYVDAAFKDWETVRDSHKDEVDAIVSDTYKKLGDVSKAGLSLETASRAVDVLAEMSRRIAELSGDALSDILDNHPKVKEKFGGSIDQLKSMAENYGPEAKKQVDQTWSQVRDIFSGGFSEENLNKARKLVEEKVQQVKSLGDETWQKGIEAAKPYLDKNPKIKELVEKNADALKQGNVSQLFEKLGSAEKSGNADDVQKYVQGAVDKVKSRAEDVAEGSGLEKYFDMIPQGGEVLEKLRNIGQIAEKHRDEGEQLLKETVEDLKKVLEKKGERAEEIVREARKTAEREAKKKTE
ncbi:apolipoprotein/apolipophorin [Pochonia chlamydosporia 170]|uniref:Apolipoprotein/apolipophorin n=1 Tax=Pochonia chlamydosporia 170 TaxID=1380566 RepID=A0A179FA89_METCM|nr:apolipoprotein/apolipophorin [Pochonia chlamydosporia 170]OAQ62372.1 apolipoprotein/apolipophorin [Pochonia chlamydosporia 170]